MSCTATKLKELSKQTVPGTGLAAHTPSATGQACY